MLETMGMDKCRNGDWLPAYSSEEKRVRWITIIVREEASGGLTER